MTSYHNTTFNTPRNSQKNFNNKSNMNSKGIMNIVKNINNNNNNMNVIRSNIIEICRYYIKEKKQYCAEEYKIYVVFDVSKVKMIKQYLLQNNTININNNNNNNNNINSN